jgi:cysteine dioxygenase
MIRAADTVLAPAPLPPALERLAAGLPSLQTPPTYHTLREAVAGCDVTLDDLAPFCRFDARSYARNRIQRTNVYEILCLCWRAGQKSPIHDHCGSQCVVKVIHGVMSNFEFERLQDGGVRLAGFQLLRPGEIDARENLAVHQVSNLQAPGNDLVTLHVYAPPLTSMRVYTSNASGEGNCVRVDPVEAMLGPHI